MLERGTDRDEMSKLWPAERLTIKWKHGLDPKDVIYAEAIGTNLVDLEGNQGVAVYDPTKMEKVWYWSCIYFPKPLHSFKDALIGIYI